MLKISRVKIESSVILVTSVIREWQYGKIEGWKLDKDEKWDPVIIS